MIGDDIMCDDYSVTEIRTCENGLTMLQSFIDELFNEQIEFIILKDGVPYKWSLWAVFDYE
jgi:hypothetical protein